eukprot:1778252-Amphidinium_carterae.1
MCDPSLPGASKVNSTLAAQCPETFHTWSEALKQVKNTWRSEWEKERASTVASTTDAKDCTLTTVILQPGDEVTLKKAKNQSEKSLKVKRD